MALTSQCSLEVVPMVRLVARGIVVLGSMALIVGCGDSDGDGSGGSGSGTGGAGSGGAGGGTTTTTGTTTGEGGTGGQGGAGGGGLADECPMLNATEPCEGGGMRGCGEAADGSGRLEWTECDQSSGAASTPLVLSFDGAEVGLAASSSAAFDLTGLGQSLATDWPNARTPWLALDRNGDGAINDGRELFGSAVEIAEGRLARHGFEALAALDENGDGRIDAADPGFAALTLWSDGDADRQTDRGELATLAARGVVSLSLSFERRAVCDARGNCGIERAAFTWLDAEGGAHEGRIIDVHLAFQDR